MKIYTKTGDAGMTSLFSGQRLPKNHPVIEAVGTVDEGNSWIGIVLAHLPKDALWDEMRTQFEIIQHALFDLGAALATPRSCHEARKLEKTRFDAEAVGQLERWIDQVEAILPPLHTFILPGGHLAAASLHLARTVIRRAERAVTPIYEEGEAVPHVLMYLNRLSDYLFMAARLLNYRLNIAEVKWQPHRPHD